MACGCWSGCARSACSNGASEAPCCARPVRIVRPSEFVSVPYRVLEEMTATCPPLAPKYCDDVLRKRACELGADVIVQQSRTLVGRRGPAQVTQRALLVRFQSKATQAAPQAQ